MKTSFYYCPHINRVFIAGQLVNTKIEYLDCIGGSGFQHELGNGHIDHIKFNNEVVTNSSQIGFGDFLTTSRATIVVRRGNGKLENVIPSEVLPIRFPRNKTETRKFIKRVKQNDEHMYARSLQRLNGNTELLNTYIVNLYALLAKTFSNIREFETEMNAITRVESTVHPDKDGKIGLCRTDNPLRPMLNAKNEKGNSIFRVV